MFYGQSNPPEDKIAAALFGDYVGTFCEVGAFNGKDLSNTMYFYERGWAGINFEPHPDNYAALCINQPEAINLCCAVGQTNEEYISIKTTPGKPIVTGFNLPKWYIKDEVPGGEAGLVDLYIPMVTLYLAFAMHGIEQVDYLSIDTDGTELAVLNGMQFEIWEPRLMIIEYNHARDRIDRLLGTHGYTRSYDNGLNAFYTRNTDDAKTIQRAANGR